jgi:lysophospholipase L1-like esterase
MNHMAATGVSGVDLYLRYDGHWRWVGVGRPSEQKNEFTLVSGLAAEKREYALYLPLYNGVTKVELGVPEGSKLDKAPLRTRNTKPVVFYGTSITQGGCASRPGMAYPAIIGRKLDVPTINLGFSGGGKCEHEVADFLAELDPSVYVIDPLPNMSNDVVDERVRYLLNTLRLKHPKTPVILIENIVYQNEYVRPDKNGISGPRNQTLARVYKDCAPGWNGKLYYVRCTKLLGSDGEGTVDGVHPTDLGFLRMADVLTPIIKKALTASDDLTNPGR